MIGTQSGTKQWIGNEREGHCVNLVIFNYGNLTNKPCSIRYIILGLQTTFTIKFLEVIAVCSYTVRLRVPDGSHLKAPL